MENKLTKENCFNELLEKYPVTHAKFLAWVDAYKVEVGWEKLFNPNYKMIRVQTDQSDQGFIIEGVNPKFHELPYDMQYGIIMRFLAETNPSATKFYQSAESFKDVLSWSFSIREKYYKSQL